MMKTNRTLILTGLAFATAFLVAATLRYGQSSKEHSGHQGHLEQMENGDHLGHHHTGEDEGKTPKSLEEIASAKCEHNVPTYQCVACRYEVGVVRIPSSLWKNTAKTNGGLLSTLKVAKQKVTPGLKATGKVKLNENTAVHISPRIPGVIDSVHVDIGMRVNEGSVLFKINSMELGKAFSDYERSCALTDLSKKNFDREKALFERKITSEQDMIEARMAFEQHRTELIAAEQALHVMGLSEENITALKKGVHGPGVSRLSVCAPIAGTIIEKHAVVGELVEPGKDVMLLADLSNMWVWADIYEHDLPKLLQAEKDGPIPVKVYVRAFPDQPFNGKIDYIAAAMTEQTRTVKVRATIENPDFALRQGMFCEINIGIGNVEEVLAVPRVALLSDEEKDFIFTHWKEDYYARRSVKRGREFFDNVEILEGLKDGETIIAEGAFLLKSDVLREKMGAGCAD